MNSTVVQNVVTYDTIIDFDNPELKLFPGMTAYVSIPVATAANVLKVPNGALRYKPDLPAEEIRALYQKSGIPENAGSRRRARPAKPKAVQHRHRAACCRRRDRERRGGARRCDPSSHVKARLPNTIRRSCGSSIQTNRCNRCASRPGSPITPLPRVIQDLNGELKAGDELVTGVAQGRASATAPRPGGPGAPRGR